MESSSITFRVAFLEHVIYEVFYVSIGKDQILAGETDRSNFQETLDQACTELVERIRDAIRLP